MWATRSRKVFLIILTLFFLMPSGCQKESDNPSRSGIKIGALFPLTGDLSDKGEDSANGVRLAVEEINKGGGVSAMDGALLEIVFADTRGTPQTGAEEAERLINQEGVVAIIGTYQSSVTKPASRISEKLETPFIVSISIADIITERGFRYTFRIQPKAGFYARDQVQFLKDLNQRIGHFINRVALLHENTDFGTSTALAQKWALKKNGFEVVADVGYRAEGVTSLDNEVARVLSAKPDVVLTVTYLKDSILIRRALVALEPSVPMIDMAGGTVSPEYIQVLGPLAEGTLTLAEYSKYSPGSKALNTKFKKRFGKDITGDSAHAYQAVLVLRDALERSGTIDKKKLRKALSETDIQKGPQLVLPAERLRFDRYGQNEFAHLYVVQVQDGELIPVWPASQTAKKVKLDGFPSYGSETTR